MLEQVEVYLGDPILSLMDTFSRDQRENKVNLSIGFYYDGEGQIPTLESVKKAKSLIDSRNQEPNTYLPMDGAANYRIAVQRHLFGESSAKQHAKIATVQSVGGSGAIKVGADFLKKYYPDSEVWVSDPTWDNHHAIFEGAGFKVNRYPYISQGEGDLKFSEMTKVLKALPKHSIVLLHTCCHNPTGIDLSMRQWDELIQLLKENELIPFLDAAYIGFGDGIEEDAYSIRAMAASGVTCFVSNSFSKVFSLYGERVGSLSVVCESADIAERVLGQLKATIRSNYSNPPRYGALLVAEILSNPELKSLWVSEVDDMRRRVIDMRKMLFNELKIISPYLNAEYLLRQKGMFSYTGFSSEQVDWMREEHAVYLIRSGRVCIAGLNSKNVRAVAYAFGGVCK